MPDLARFRRPRRRLASAIAASAVLGAVALAAPSSADAYYEQHFCQYVYLTSTQQCAAQYRHTLQTVSGWTIGNVDRICVATRSGPWGAQNSDWRCEYGFVQRIYNGNVVGVGVIRNGDPNPFYGYGVQEF